MFSWSVFLSFVRGSLESEGFEIFTRVFSLTVIVQLFVITYIIVAYNNPDVPVHFTLTGTADSFGKASEYFFLIGINLFVYVLMLVLGRFAKVNVEEFGMYKDEEERRHVERVMRKKVRIFLQILGANFSLFVSLLVLFVLSQVLNHAPKYHLSPIGIIAFLVSNIVIVIFGLVWMNTNNTKKRLF